MKLTIYSPRLPLLGLSDVQISEAINKFIEDNKYPVGLVRKKLENREKYFLEKHKKAIKLLNESNKSIQYTQGKIDDLSRDIFRKLNILREEIGFDTES